MNHELISRQNVILDMFETPELRQVSDWLYKLGKNEVKPADITHGICENLVFQFNKIWGRKIIEAASFTWKEWSGDITYPVPSVNTAGRFSSLGIYFCYQKVHQNMWIIGDEYCDSRRRLCFHSSAVIDAYLSKNKEETSHE